MDKVQYLNGRTVLYDLGGAIRASTIPYTFPYDPSVPALEQREKANRLTGRINISLSVVRTFGADRSVD